MDTDKLLSDWDRVTASAQRPRTAPRSAGVRGTGVALRLAGGAVMVTLLIAALAWVAPRPGGSQVGGVLASPSASAATCPVTVPNAAHTTGWPASPLDHGVDGLYTVLWPDGVIAVPPDGVDSDGVLSMKMVFFRDPSAAGAFSVSGRRLDGVSLPLRADIPDGYGESGVQATGLVFPAAGCWEVTVTSGPATMTFVTQVQPIHYDDLIGQPAPAVSGARLDGTPITVDLGGGRPALVNFTAGFWCPPCTDEQQQLANLRSTLGSAGIDLVTVLVHGTAEDDARFVADQGITGTVVRDPDGTTLDAYAGFGVPLSVLVDADGVIRRFIAGPLTADELAVVLPLLDASPSPAAP